MTRTTPTPASSPRSSSPPRSRRGATGDDSLDGTHPWSAYNENIEFYTRLRGYLSTTITPASMTANYRCVPFVSSPGAPVFTRAQFVVEDGVRGMNQTQDNPTASLRSIGRRASLSPDPAQMVRNTLLDETGSPTAE